MGRDRCAGALRRCESRSSRRRRERTDPGADAAGGWPSQTSAAAKRKVPDSARRGTSGEMCRRPRSRRGGAPRSISSRPGQVGGTAEELLVEVVADTPDGLGHEQRGCCGVKEARDVGTAAAEHAGLRRLFRRAMPPQIPRPPLQTARGPHQWSGTSFQLVDQEVEASTDQPGGEGPEGDLVNEFARAPLTLASDAR